MSAAPGAQTEELKAALDFVCALLARLGIAGLSAETLRRAKFNQPDVVPRLLRALHAYAHVEAGGFPKDGAERAKAAWAIVERSGRPEEAAAEHVQKQFRKWGFSVPEFFAMRVGALHSRELLIALGFTVSRARLFERYAEADWPADAGPAGETSGEGSRGGRAPWDVPETAEAAAAAAERALGEMERVLAAPAAPAPAAGRRRGPFDSDDVDALPERRGRVHAAVRLQHQLDMTLRAASTLQRGLALSLSGPYAPPRPLKSGDPSSREERERIGGAHRDLFWRWMASVMELKRKQAEAAAAPGPTEPPPEQAAGGGPPAAPAAEAAAPVSRPARVDAGGQSPSSHAAPAAAAAAGGVPPGERGEVAWSELQRRLARGGGEAARLAAGLESVRPAAPAPAPPWPRLGAGSGARLPRRPCPARRQPRRLPPRRLRPHRPPPRARSTSAARPGPGPVPAPPPAPPPRPPLARHAPLRLGAAPQRRGLRPGREPCCGDPSPAQPSPGRPARPARPPREAVEAALARARAEAGAIDRVRADAAARARLLLRRHAGLDLPPPRSLRPARPAALEADAQAPLEAPPGPEPDPEQPDAYDDVSEGGDAGS
eukprot:tig00021326_g20289.t1